MVVRFNDKIIAILLALENTLAWRRNYWPANTNRKLGMFLKA